MSLTSAPVFGPTFVTALGNGAVVLKANPKPPFPNAIVLPQFNKSYSSMVQVFISHFLSENGFH
jgi:hypothetical protein